MGKISHLSKKIQDIKRIFYETVDEIKDRQ